VKARWKAVISFISKDRSTVFIEFISPACY